MAITKIGGMLRTGKIHRIIFAIVDKSLHCIQMHYIQDELKEITSEIIFLSKNLSELKKKNLKNN